MSCLSNIDFDPLTPLKGLDSDSENTHIMYPEPSHSGEMCSPKQIKAVTSFYHISIFDVVFTFWRLPTPSLTSLVVYCVSVSLSTVEPCHCVTVVQDETEWCSPLDSDHV